MGVDMTQTLLLQALGKQPSEGQSITDLIDPSGDADTRMNLVLQYLAQRQSEAQKAEVESPPEEEKAEDPEVIELAEERNRLMSELHKKAELMYQELEVLRARNDQLAAGLGACYLCWGEDFNCVVCGGRGKSGYFVPDRQLFEEFFLPAARRIQHISRPNGPTRLGTRPQSNGNGSSSQPFERREQ